MSDITQPPANIADLPLLANQLNDQQKINLAKFDAPQRQRIQQIAATVGRVDSVAATTFGAEAQQKINLYLDDLLKGLKMGQVGQAGAITLDLARHIKALKLPKMKAEAEGGDWLLNKLGQLPAVGSFVSSLRAFQLKHKEVLTYLGEVEDRARREVGKLAATDAKLSTLMDQTLANIKEFEYHLAAGQALLMRARTEFADRRAQLESSADPLAAASLRDQAEQINAFESRLLRMNIAFTDALVAIPQIRLAQEAARIEGRNIMDTLLFDLPRLKSAILRVVALKQINEANKSNEARRQIARQIGTIGADALDEAYQKAKVSEGYGVEDVAMLAETADRLLETIAKGVRLDAENQQKRAAAERQLEEIRGKLRTGLQENMRQFVKLTG